MTGVSKPLPWNWSFRRTLAAKLGLPAPVLFWPLWEGGGGLAAEVQLGAAGALAPTSVRPLWEGGGLRLTGNYYVSVPRHQAMDQTSLTLLAWATATSASGNQELISRDNASGSAPRVFQFRLESGVLQFIPFFGGTAVTTIKGTTNLADSKPHLLSATLGSGFARLYIDGRLEYEVAETRALDTGDRSLTLGRNAGANSQFFVGIHRGGMLLPGALTPAQMGLLGALPYAYHCRASHAALLALQSNPQIRRLLLLGAG